MVVEIAKDEAEEDRHVGVVVKWHTCSLLYEKEDEAVVFGVQAVNCHSVQVALEVVRTVALTGDAHLFRCHGVHTFDELLAAGIGDRAI